MSDSKLAPMNTLYGTHHVSSQGCPRSSKVVWDHWPRVTSSGRFFSWGRFWGILGCFLTYFGNDLLNTADLPRVFDLTSRVISWPETLSLGTIDFLSSKATRSLKSRSFSSVRGQTREGSYPPPLCRRGLWNGQCRRGLNTASNSQFSCR